MAKKIIALVLALALTLCCSAALANKLDDIKASGKLIVGSGLTFAPYEFWYTNPETGEEEMCGFEMDLARGLAAELGVELEVHDLAFSGLITALRSGELDCIIAGMSIKPDRAEVVDFSTPYFAGSQVVVVREADFDLYKTPDDFIGKHIGAQTGSLQQGIAEEQFPQSECLLLDRVPLLMLELMQGNVDGVLATDVVAKSYMNVYEGLAISEVPINYTSSGVAVAIQQGDDGELMQVINDYIERVTTNGEFDSWFEEALRINGLLLQEAENAAEAEESAAETEGEAEEGEAEAETETKTEG